MNLDEVVKVRVTGDTLRKVKALAAAEECGVSALIRSQINAMTVFSESGEWE